MVESDISAGPAITCGDHLRVAPVCGPWRATDASSQVQLEAAAPDSATRSDEPG
jgi:hypothetical protein